MPWDGIKKRSSDKGLESPEVLLARIDERTENMDTKIDKQVNDFDQHKREDDKNFAGLYKWIFIGVGIIGTLQFVVIVTKH